MARINGASIRGALKYVKESGAPGGIRGLLDALPPTARPTFDRPILAGVWYPYDAYAELLATIDARLGRGDTTLMRDLGHFGARQDAGGPFKFVRIFKSLSRITPRAHTFWPRHCDAGRFENLDHGEDYTRSVLYDFPHIHPCHCVQLGGWLEGMCLAMDARSASATHTECVHRGGRHCEFLVQWSV